MPEANYHVAENPTIEKTLEKDSSKAEKEVKGKIKAKGKGKKWQRKRKRQRKKQKKKERKKNKRGEIEFDSKKNMLHLQRNNVVRKLTLSISFQNITALLMYFLL